MTSAIKLLINDVCAYIMSIYIYILYSCLSETGEKFRDVWFLLCALAIGSSCHYGS